MPTTNSSRLRELVAAFDAERPLASAETPPSAWYTDAELYALERRSVFERSWQYAGLADWVREEGQYFAVDLGHEPVMVAHTAEGLVALSNVCRHRGGPLVREGSGRASSWSCLYHGWNYALDGRLRKAPELEGVEDFDRACVHLPRWQIARMGPFLFVCAAEDAEPLETCAPGLTDRITELRPEELVHAARRVYSVGCNWKVFVDNYLDGGYHVPVLHPGLSGSLDYARYRCTLHEGWNLQQAPMRSGEAGAVRRGEAAHYIWAWPNWMFNAYEGVLDINWVRPRGVSRCEVIFDYFFAPDTDEAFIKESLRVAEQVQEEDREICEAVQRGLESSHYDVGRYSVRRENGDHQFHQMLARALRTSLEG